MTDITLTLTNLSPATASAVLALIQGDAPATEGKPPKPARTAAKTSAPETSPETTPQTAPEPSSSEAAPSTDETDGAGTASSDITYDQVRAAVLSLTAKRGRDAAVRLIGEFENVGGKPAANGKELQEADWPVFLARAAAAEEGKEELA